MLTRLEQKVALMTPSRLTIGALALVWALTLSACQSGPAESPASGDAAQSGSSTATEEGAPTAGFTLELGEQLGIEGYHPS